MSDASLITNLRAREVLDCRGLPTVQVDLELDGGATGDGGRPVGPLDRLERGVELRDGGDALRRLRRPRRGRHVNGEIATALVGAELPGQRELDPALIDLDGTPDKSRLGANAILGVSLAAARARAAARATPLYRALNANAHVLPVPLVNLINGGKHASNDLDFQEFIMIPVGAELDPRGAADLDRGQPGAGRDPARALRQERAQHAATRAATPRRSPSPHEALGLLHEAVADAGHEGRFRYGLDCAATHYYDRDAGTYLVAGADAATATG